MRPPAIPRPRSKNTNKVRRELQIPHRDAIDRLDLLYNLVKFELEKRGVPAHLMQIFDEHVLSDAKHLLVEYREKVPAEYYGGSPTVTALSALYIAFLKNGGYRYVRQKDLSNPTRTSTISISRKYREIMRKLGIEIPAD